MTATALSASAVSAGYGLGDDAAAPVLAGIDFELPAGECLAVVGRSGCGKSTLLNVLAGVHPPATGWVRAGDETVAAGDWRQVGSPGCTSGHAAYLFQQDLLLPWKGALANAVFAARVAAGRATRHERQDLEERATGLLREFGLGDNLESLPRELSGGMRQRVALARTVLMDRGVILLDEPFGSLDAVTRAEMRLWLLDVMAAHPGDLGAGHSRRGRGRAARRPGRRPSRPAGAARGLGAGRAEPRPAPRDRGSRCGGAGDGGWRAGRGRGRRADGPGGHRRGRHRAATGAARRTVGVVNAATQVTVDDARSPLPD